MTIFKLLLDVIAPKKCYSCNKEWHFFCPQCQKSEYKFDSVCYVCKWNTLNYKVHDLCKKDIYYDKIIILNHYKQKYTKKLIRDSKFYNKTSIYDDFTEFLYEKFLLNEKIIYKSDYIVTWVPSHFIKKIKRWYNWSQILAKNFSKISWIKYIPNILKKIKNTSQQSDLNRKQRLINLKWAYVFNNKFKSIIKWKNIIIIDDVISTWATINELSFLLKENQSNKIIWLIIASD